MTSIKINKYLFVNLYFIFLLLLTSCSSTLDIGKSVNINTDVNKTGYVEYLPGTLPIVISVPHGGYLMPDSIPNRDCDGCVTVRDSYTQELARSIRNNFFNKTGEYPHMVINLLSRKKFDANRDIGDAADGIQIVEKAWSEYHSFLDDAKVEVNKNYNRGLFIDLHGHGHKVKRLELGYLLDKEELQVSNSQLNSNEFINKSSIKILIDTNKQNLTHSEILKGKNSLGTTFENYGVAAVPSTSNPFPLKGEKYFSGGYNTKRHGSLKGGNIDAIQIECHSTIRFDATKREQFASVFVTAVNEYLELNYLSK